MEKTPEGYLPIPTSTAPPSYTPEQTSSKLSTTKKLALLASVSGGLFYLASKCGGGHSFPDLWDGDFQKGWEIVKHKGMKSHWEEQAWEWDSSKERGHHNIQHKKLGTSTLKLSEPVNDEFRPNATVALTAAESFWLNLEDGVQAELQFVPSKEDAVSFYVEQILQSSQVDESTLASYDSLKVVDDNENPEKSGLIISRGNNAQSSPSYIISISLPTAGRPFSFHADGNSLAVPTTDLKGIKFDAFSLAAGVTDKVELNNLHAREASVDLSFGAIIGSFDVSRELILRTVAGVIQANVTLFEIPHHHHPKHKHGKKNGTEFEELPPPPKDGKKHPHPPHFPPFVTNVVTTTGVGAIDLQYIGDIPTNHTSLLSKSVAKVGEVRVTAPAGYKGKFVEGSRIGEVSYGFVPGVNVTIDKEVHHGPGGFIKGFVGDHPPPPPKHHPPPPPPSKHLPPPPPPKHPKEGGPDKKEAGHPHGRPEAENYEKRHHPMHKMHGDDDDDDEHRVHKHHHHHHEENDEEEVHAHKHKDEKKPKGPKGPKGPKKDHRGPPHPPPGYGFVGAFTGTGKTEVFFA